MIRVKLKTVFPLSLYSKEIKHEIMRFLLKEDVYSQFVNFQARIVEKQNRVYGIPPRNIFNISEAVPSTNWNQIAIAWNNYIDQKYKQTTKTYI